VAAGVDNKLLDRFMRAKARGDDATARSILGLARVTSMAPALSDNEDPLLSVRVAALRPYVNSLDAASLQQYILCMIEVSSAVVVGLEGQANWSVPGVVDAVAEVVREATVAHLRKCSDWPFASGAASVSRSSHKVDGATQPHDLIDEAQFAALVGWSAARIDQALASNSIFSVSVEGARYFPRFLADSSKSGRHLNAVCRLLGELSGPSKLQFFSTPKASLGGATPLEALLQRRYAEVKAAAEGFVGR
jgi:hypothetical protein